MEPIERKNLLPMMPDKKRGTWSQELTEKVKSQWGFSDKTLSLPLTDLEPHPLQPRHQPNPEEVEGLANSILLHGLGTPLFVMPRADDPHKFYILDGTRRWSAVKYLRWGTVQCYIGPGLKNEQALALMLAMDSSRETFSPLERGISFRVLREQLQFSQRQLAKFLNLPQSEVSRCETLGDFLSQAIIEAISTKPELRWISHNHLRQLIRLRDLPEKQEQIFAQMIEEKWSSRKLAGKIDEILQKNPNESYLHIELSNEAFTAIVRFKKFIEGDENDIFRHLATLNFRIFEKYNIDFKRQAEWYGSMAELARILAMGNQADLPINSILEESEQEKELNQLKPLKKTEPANNASSAPGLLSIIMQKRNMSPKEMLKSLNVLIADDISAVRNVFVEILRDLGVGGRIDTAGDGLEAWEMMQLNDYDVVISDVRMPVMSGLELRKLIRATPRFARLPFLLISGEVSGDTMECAIESERDGYLRKPFSIAELKRRILQLLE